MKQCPFCAEMIQTAAIKCRYCGEDLNSDGARWAGFRRHYASLSPEGQQAAYQRLSPAQRREVPAASQPTDEHWEPSAQTLAKVGKKGAAPAQYAILWLVAGLGLAVVLTMWAIGKKNPAYQTTIEGRSLERPSPSPSGSKVPESNWLDSASQQEIHEELRSTFRGVVDRASHNYYNGVTVKIVRNGKGYDLWAYHSFFSRYSLDAGDFGKAISLWTISMGDVLSKGNVKRVGVHGTGAYASWQWYPVGDVEPLAVRQAAAKQLLDLVVR